MEFYIILGFVLFIAGVAGTFLYDHVKAEMKKREDFLAAGPPRPVRKTTTATKTVKYSEASANEQFLKQFAAHVKSQTKPTVTAKDGSVNSTMTVEELIKKLELMKKNL